MKLTKNKKQKLMGKIVKVNTIYASRFIKENKVWNKYPIFPKLAWITGFGNIKEGNIYTDNDANYFIPTEIISVVKVRFDYKSKEVNIPLDSFELTDNTELPEAQHEIKNRIEMQDMYHKRPNLFPRDKKGRFIGL